jgi:hypothetical protein
VRYSETWAYYFPITIARKGNGSETASFRPPACGCRFAPKADDFSEPVGTSRGCHDATSFSPREQSWLHFDERPGGFQVDDEFEYRRALDG